ncbi:MAG: hypothetical protein EHM48_02325 [Planctomycetaceae bacterium]|nr:MAG: hypothetical protein EHM48_02325 [Planctomycetaceae bacterium]
MPHTFDIAILGATPAGYAAACRLADAGKDVIVIDSPREPVDCPLTDWIPADFFEISGLPKALAKTSAAEPFNDVVFHDIKLTKEALYHNKKAAGYFLDTARLLAALASAAGKAGAKNRKMVTSPAIRLEEDCVVIVGSSQIHARLLIVAQNRPEHVFSELALPVRSVPASPIIVAAIDVPLPGKSAANKPAAGQLHIIQLATRGELGLYFATKSLIHIRVIRESGTSARHAAELSQLVGNLQKAGLLPTDLPLGKARGAVWHPPAGVALELETHVAKRTLLTGSAGGFADSITGATLSSSVQSAMLGAKSALAALDSDDTQNALASFKTSWRKELADQLRPPNTSLPMIMPLLFSNSRLMAKFATALLHGESI